jgi:hypothetical protein
MKRAIEIDERHFDPDHPTLAIRYNNLGHIELAEGNRLRACELLRRAEAILAKQFSSSHPRRLAVAEMMQRVCGEGEASGSA